MNNLVLKKLVVSFVAVVMISQSFTLVYGADGPQLKPTSENTLDVRFATEPSNPEPKSDTKMKIDFLKKDSKEIQKHIDYTLAVTKNNEELFNVEFTHTSTGSVAIPYQFPEDGKYTVTINVLGILFQPIPEESVSFPVSIGEDVSEPSSNGDQTSIPNWIRNNAGWWADGKIGDADFVSGIQWLIKNGVMKIPETAQGAGGDGEETTQIPNWIKQNAGWWADGKIGDADFVSGIQWLIKNGIMKI